MLRGIFCIRGVFLVKERLFLVIHSGGRQALNFEWGG